MIKIVNKNIVKAEESVIAHQVNCKGVMGSGVARAIRNKFPEVYDEYRKFLSNTNDVLGYVQYVVIPREKKIIANLFAQDNYGYDKQYTDYDALESCFLNLAHKSLVPIAMPYKIGCGCGGGDWDNVVFPMIDKIFTGRTVVLYKM